MEANGAGSNDSLWLDDEQMETRLKITLLELHKKHMPQIKGSGLCSRIAGIAIPA